MFILRRLNWKSKEVKEEDVERYDLHQDIWIRCMQQIRMEREERFERMQYEKRKKEFSMNSSKSITRNIKNSSNKKKIAEEGLIVSHQDSFIIRRAELPKKN